MHDIQWYDYLRLITVVLSSLAFYRLAIIAFRHRETYTSRLIDFLWLIFASLFLVTVAGVEAIIQNSPWGYRTLLNFLVAAIGLRATRSSEEPLQKL